MYVNVQNGLIVISHEQRVNKINILKFLIIGIVLWLQRLIEYLDLLSLNSFKSGHRENDHNGNKFQE